MKNPVEFTNGDPVQQDIKVTQEDPKLAVENTASEDINIKNFDCQTDVEAAKFIERMVKDMANTEGMIKKEVTMEDEGVLTKANALKVGAGVAVGVAAKCVYDHFTSGDDNAAGSMEIASAISDLF